MHFFLEPLHKLCKQGSRNNNLYGVLKFAFILNQRPNLSGLYTGNKSRTTSRRVQIDLMSTSSNHDHAITARPFCEMLAVLESSFRAI